MVKEKEASTERITSVPRKIPDGFPEHNSYTMGLPRYNEIELGFFKDHILIHIAAKEQEKKDYESYLIAPEDVNNKDDQLSNDQNQYRINEICAYLVKLHSALVRIDKGIYGICKTSGKLIQPGRLFSTPAATEEKDVKEKNSLQIQTT